ncbi:MAG: hypothetical protein QGF78_07295 [Candidatus Bathyarchaeota archaeon]|nr:hypothetical protein [Candidatus Bathyarchaeota archaeon]
MQLLREYIRQILLEGEIHPKIEAQLEKALKMGLRFDMLNWGGAAGGNASISITLDDSDGNTVGQLQARYDKPRTGPCNGAAVISGQGVKVSHGLGPLLYDLAFEIAEKKGLQGLGPDPREVSDEAAAVWDYYLNNRPDIEARQRDFMEDPQTPPPDDDCYGQKDLAKKFGGTEKAYSSSKHIEPIGFDDPEEGYTVPTGYTPEFIEHYFDPKNSLSKTYHKKSSGTPILDRLGELAQLSPTASRDLGAPQSREQIIKYLEDNPKRWPNKKFINWEDRYKPESRLPIDDVVAQWQGDPTP